MAIVSNGTGSISLLFFVCSFRSEYRVTVDPITIYGKVGRLGKNHRVFEQAYIHIDAFDRCLT